MKKSIFISLALLLVCGVAGCSKIVTERPIDTPVNQERPMGITSNDLTAEDDVIAGHDLTVTDDAVIGDDLTVTDTITADDLKVGDDSSYAPIYVGAGDGCSYILFNASTTITSGATSTSFCK